MTVANRQRHHLLAALLVFALTVVPAAGHAGAASQPARAAPLSRFGRLWSAAVDTDGTVFVLDRAAATVLKLSRTGRLLRRWYVPPIRIPNQPSDLTGIAIGPHHTVYLTDAFNYQIITLTPNGQIVASWDTRDLQAGQTSGPFGLASDALGNLYTVNFASSDVEKYSAGGKLLMTFGRACPQPVGSDAAPAACTDTGHLAPGELNHPDGLALDRTGNIYVSDHRSKRVVKFSAGGQELAVFGPELGASYGTFGLTEGVAVDGQGNLYVEDRGGPRIVKLSPDGVPLAQWQAPRGYVPEGNPGLDAAGNLYLTLNAANRACRVIKLSPGLQVLGTWK